MEDYEIWYHILDVDDCHGSAEADQVLIDKLQTMASNGYTLVTTFIPLELRGSGFVFAKQPSVLSDRSNGQTKA